jgi:hypothetical protein
MRKQLKERIGRRGHFRATFRRFGTRPAFKGPERHTALFINVKDEAGDIVADHIWFTVGSQLSELELQPGDEIFFVARVTKYWKRNREAAFDPDAPERIQDYHLSNPSKMQKLSVQVTHPMPLFDAQATSTEA